MNRNQLKKKQRKESKINYVTKSSKNMKLDGAINVQEESNSFEEKITLNQELDVEIYQEQNEENQTFIELAGKLKKNSYIMLSNNKPCKIFEYSSSKAGKHGSAKISFGGQDIFTKKKYYDSYPSQQYVVCPFVEKSEWKLVDLKENEEEEKYIIDIEDKQKNRLEMEVKSKYGEGYNALYDKVCLEDVKEGIELKGKEIIFGLVKAMGKHCINEFKIVTRK